MEKLWENYEKIRCERCLMDVQIAEKAGMTRQALNRIKTRGNPTVKTLMKIARAMDVKPEAFFLGMGC